MPASRRLLRLRASSRLARRLPAASVKQPVVMVGGLGQAKHGLEHALQVGRGQQVRAPRHQRHPLRRVVHHHREMVAGADVAARHHGVAEQAGCDRHRAGFGVRERQRPRHGTRPRAVEAQRRLASRRPVPGNGRRVEATAGAGVKRAPSGPWGAAPAAAISAAISLRVQKQG